MREAAKKADALYQGIGRLIGPDEILNLQCSLQSLEESP